MDYYVFTVDETGTKNAYKNFIDIAPPFYETANPGASGILSDVARSLSRFAKACNPAYTHFLREK